MTYNYKCNLPFEQFLATFFHQWTDLIGHLRSNLGFQNYKKEAGYEILSETFAATLNN